MTTRLLQLTRRQWLALAAAAALPAPWSRAAMHATTPTHPFALGVASGPGDAGGVVLWTRLVPQLDAELAQLSGLDLDRYLAERTRAERDARAAPERTVLWELAADDRFTRIVTRGSARALPALAHSVHVEIDAAELEPGRPYWYRFMLGDATSAIGRTMALPRPGASLEGWPEGWRVGLASCQHYEHGHFGAYVHLRADDPQAVLFVGDYIYEGNPRPERFRPHPFPAARTLFDYRLRHALYKRDPHLQAMHAHCPWWLTWDDHEVSNDYAGDVGEDPRVDGAARRRAAYQAYYEHMPLPASALIERFSQVRVYRQHAVGSLINVVLLDDRQYRDPQVCPRPGANARGGSRVIEDPPCTERRSAERSLLGREQMSWLAGALRSEARWTLIGQQTLFSPLWSDAAHTRYWNDGWDGYPAERQRVLDALVASQARNPIICGGDMHANFVCDVHRDVDHATSTVIATEFCGTSITSPSGLDAVRIAALRPLNPHIRFADSSLRGYALFDFTRDQLRVALRVMDDVQKDRTEVSTAAEFVVKADKAGAERV